MNVECPKCKAKMIAFKGGGRLCIDCGYYDLVEVIEGIERTNQQKHKRKKRQ